MQSPMQEVMQGYATLASSLLERWNAHALKVASNLETPGYDAASAASDVAACASLATESGCQLAEQALDALGILYGSGYGSSQNIVETPPFQAPAGTELTLVGPLVLDGGFDELPVSVVTIQPSRLAPGETEFILLANATGHNGGTYIGTVTATAPAAFATGSTPVTVWITVP